MGTKRSVWCHILIIKEWIRCVLLLSGDDGWLVRGSLGSRLLMPAYSLPARIRHACFERSNLPLLWTRLIPDHLEAIVIPRDDMLTGLPNQGTAPGKPCSAPWMAPSIAAVWACAVVSRRLTLHRSSNCPALMSTQPSRMGLNHLRECLR